MSSKAQNKKSLFSKALSSDSDLSKDELFTVLHYLRQVVSLVIGVLCGYFHLTGIFVIIGYMLILTAIVHFYTNRFLNFDDEKVEGHEIYTEAMGIGFMVFMLSWVLCHTFIVSPALF